MYELLMMMIKKFYSLKNKCTTMMDLIMTMAINYIESVDDENFLTAAMLEQDYSGRDFLKIAVDLELLELIQAPKVEAVIKIVYNSNYEQLGSIFQMSTTYQICFGNKNIKRDPEKNNRFYLKRDISDASQSLWMYEIYK